MCDGLIHTKGAAPMAKPPDRDDSEARRAALRQVLWIGGAPDAGKSTATRTLAAAHGWHAYHLDAAGRSHEARTTPERQPHLSAFLAMTMDERWVVRSPAAMAAHVLQTGPEYLALAIEDLMLMPTEPPILAEGPWFFPADIAPLLSHPRQAIWLVPTEEFKRASAARRDKPQFRHDTSDPECATRNWLARDLLLGKLVRRQARELGLAVYEVDGSRTVEETAALLERHFAPVLAEQANTDG
jgi:hypothetical protein